MHWTHQQIRTGVFVGVLVLATVAGVATVSWLSRPSADSYTPSTSVNLTVSPSVIHPGDAVTLTVTNNASVPVTLPTQAPYTITNNAGTVFAPFAAQAAATLQPGHSRSWTWNQQDANGARVAVGGYTATVPYQLTGTSTTSATATFIIQPIATTTEAQ